MGFNAKDYQKGRGVGLELAERLYQEQGIEALERDVMFRTRTGISTDASTNAMDKGAFGMKNIYFETTLVMAVNILRDEFDYGKKRAMRFIEEWKRVKEYACSKDLAWWLEERDRIAEELEMDLFRFFSKKMPKTDSYDDGRLDGMKKYLECKKTGKEEELRTMMLGRVKQMKINKNNITQINKVNRMMEKQNAKIMPSLEDICFETVITLMVYTVHKFLKFGEKRSLRFVKRWDLKHDCLNDKMITWQDLVGVMEDELDIHEDLDMMVVEGWIAKEC